LIDDTGIRDLDHVTYSESASENGWLLEFREEFKRPDAGVLVYLVSFLMGIQRLPSISNIVGL